MAQAKEQTWRVDLDEVQMTIQYITRADDKVRQTFDMKELPKDIRELLSVRGGKVTLEERNSSVPASAIQASMDSRQETWDNWMAGNWAKARTGGGFQHQKEVEAMAAIKTEQLGKTVTSAMIRKALKGMGEEAREKALTSEKVKAKMQELAEESGDDLDLENLD